MVIIYLNKLPNLISTTLNISYEWLNGYANLNKAFKN